MEGILGLFELAGLILQAAIYLVIFIVIAVVAAIDAKKTRLNGQDVESDNSPPVASMSTSHALLGIVEGIVAIVLALVGIFILLLKT